MISRIESKSRGKADGVSSDQAPHTDELAGGRPVHSDSLEFELLRLCARVTVDPIAAERIRALARECVDWNVLIARAHQHSVLPLLCRSLERVASDLVPEAAMRRLRTAFRANAMRNLSLTAELFSVLDLFHGHDIPCIPYKGSVLAAIAYGDISLRQFGDLDVIVPVTDVPRAVNILVSNGYRADKTVADDQQLPCGGAEKDVTLRRDGGVTLELHWGITTDMFHPIQIPSQLLWRDLASASVAGRLVPTHKSEDLLLIQCVHGVSHGWQRLGWLCDVAEILRSRPDMEWDRVFQTAAGLGSRRILCHALALARDLLGTSLPAGVVRAIEQDPALLALSEQVKGWLVSDHPVPLGETQRYFIRLREHPAHKLRVVIKQAKSYLALTSRDAEAFPVPGCLNWMLYIVRPFRLARDYGLSPFLRFFRGVFQV